MLKKSVFLGGQFLLAQMAYAEPVIDVAAIVKANSDAVVAVITPKNLSPESRYLENAGAAPQQFVLGSGFIISEDGYIVTNCHVIERENQIKVKFKNLQELPATLVGIDRATDIALLKINGSNLQKVKIGSSTALEIGQPVIAMGWPFGLGQSVTAGIVSAKDLIVPKKGNVGFIQTDAVLNEGNSGGPLFDSHGAVVGVNSWIYTNSGRYQGMSFAVPIDLTMHVIDLLKKAPKFSRGYIGIKTEDAQMSFPAAQGALISSIASDSPAINAGLREGDIVIAFNQQMIRSSDDLTEQVKNTPADTIVVFDVIRQGQRRVIKAKTGRNVK